MEPFFFGAAGDRLLGVAHPAKRSIAQGHGVVVCYPQGHEYVNSLRGCRQVALVLSRRGFDVLRFDYFGTGDSGGDGESATLARWQNDISAAIDEFKLRQRLSRVSLIGVRLGASLAALVASAREDIWGTVLWDPVVLGANYAAEHRQKHSSFLDYERAGGRAAHTYDSDNEIMGFPVSPRMASELDQMDLRTLQRKPSERVLVIQNEDDPTVEELSERLRQRGSVVSHERFPGQKIWVREPGQERAQAPKEIMDTVTMWFAN